MFLGKNHFDPLGVMNSSHKMFYFKADFNWTFLEILSKLKKNPSAEYYLLVINYVLQVHDCATSACLRYKCTLWFPAHLYILTFGHFVAFKLLREFTVLDKI